MALSAEQRARRVHTIGSSDASKVVLGRDVWGNTDRDVYWSKVLPSPDNENSSKANGRYLEPAIVSWAADHLGVEVERDVEIIVPGQIPAANLDALVVGKRQAIEAKFCTFREVAEQYGEEGTDQIPTDTLIQCMHQIAVGDLDLAWVAVLLMYDRNVSWRMYQVKRDEELCRQIIDKENEWWQKYIVTKTPPDGIEVPPLPALKAMHREPASRIALVDDVGEMWRQYQELGVIAKTAEEWREAKKTAIIACLGDSECGDLPDGRSITFVEQNSQRRVDLDRMRILYPEAYADLVTQGKHRALRMKTPKGYKAVTQTTQQRLD